DEQRADTMAVYGNTKIHAPNLNKFTDECVVFRNAYVAQPVCTPSRTCVMTGLWPHQSGMVKNNLILPKGTPCFPEILNDPDYRTAYMGKWHLGDELYPQHGFQEWASIEDIYNAYFSPGHDENDRSDYHRFLVEHGQTPEADGKFSRSFASKLPLELSKPKFLEGKACDFLRRHRDEPFILYVNFLEPHMPYYGPLNGEHDPAEVNYPANFTYPLGENEPARYRRMQEVYHAKECKDEQTLRAAIARYWGLVTEVDLSVGAILKTLEDLGLADNTLVAYSSDHGDMMGSHCLMAKGVMYQEATHVPWMMRVPWMGRKQTVIDQPVGHIDMVPTLLDLMGHAPEERLSGHSLVPLIQGGKPAEDHVFVEWNTSDDVKPPLTASAGKKAKKDKGAGAEEGGGKNDKARFRAVIAPDGWKLSLSDADKNQLFNLAKDPGETVNLFGQKEFEDVQRRLTEKIHQWQEKARDSVKV
ncbi:MAG: sulfatase-like hydrolase/transferase, partial [Candidatus Sumerlaeota bacterium]|nr:sulfatase-like hydrolase/transferase [Candidatus Sumerlaeota bacterium]